MKIETRIFAGMLSVILLIGIFQIPTVAEGSTVDYDSIESEFSLMSVSNGTGVTIYERTTSLYSYSFEISVLMSGGGTFDTLANEHYTVTSDGTYLTIHCYRSTTAGGVGANIASVRLDGVPGFANGIYASTIINYSLGFDGTSDGITNALGESFSNHTGLGDYDSEIVLGFTIENDGTIPPIANAGPNQTEDTGVEIQFNGSGSYDPDGTIVSYTWNFGDGNTGTDITALHIYGAAGNYTVELMVTDDDGLTDTDTCQITVTEPYVPDPIGADLSIDKVKIAGPDVVETHTKYGWTLRITVSNTGDSDALDVVMHDVLPSELEMIDFTKSAGIFTFEQNGGSQTGSTALIWDIGTMASGESETLDIVITTRFNPAGKQEFTSPGTYSLNDGACVTGIDTITGEELLAGPTPKITVIAIEGNDDDFHLIQVSNGSGVTIFERTTDLYSYTFETSVLMSGGGTFDTLANEHYTVTSDGTYLTIHCYRSTTAGGVGANIASVRLDGVPGFANGIYASTIINYSLGYDGTSDGITNALGESFSNHTGLGDYDSEITLGFTIENDGTIPPIANAGPDQTENADVENQLSNNNDKEIELDCINIKENNDTKTIGSIALPNVLEESDNSEIKMEKSVKSSIIWLGAYLLLSLIGITMIVALKEKHDAKEKLDKIIEALDTKLLNGELSEKEYYMILEKQGK